MPCILKQHLAMWYIVLPEVIETDSSTIQNFSTAEKVTDISAAL